MSIFHSFTPFKNLSRSNIKLIIFNHVFIFSTFRLAYNLYYLPVKLKLLDTIKKYGNIFTNCVYSFVNL